MPILPSQANPEEFSQSLRPSSPPHAMIESAVGSRRTSWRAFRVLSRCIGRNLAADLLSSKHPGIEQKGTPMANTTGITDKIERKKLKRAARKKAAPKAPRTGARGENKQKLKKATRGQSKR